jgi:YVTN family beta-propeller protein
MIIAAVSIAPNATLGNHYILPCRGDCEPEAAFAYIGNSASDNVTVIDTGTDTVVATVNVGQHTFGIAVNPTLPRVYAANGQKIAVIDTAANALVATIAYGTDPDIVAGVAVNPAGTRVYVTDQYIPGVAVIDAATNTVIAKVTTGYHSFNITVSPDGTRVYATSIYDDMISVIDTGTNSLVANIPISNPYFSPPIGAGDFAAGPSGIVVNAAGTRAYVANAFLHDPADWVVSISVIDTATNTLIANVPTGSPTRALSIAVNLAGTRVYVSNGAVIDTATNTVVAAIPSCGELEVCGLAINPRGTRIYLTRENPPGVLVVDSETSAVLATIPIDGVPLAFGQFIGP